MAICTFSGKSFNNAADLLAFRFQMTRLYFDRSRLLIPAPMIPPLPMKPSVGCDAIIDEQLLQHERGTPISVTRRPWRLDAKKKEIKEIKAMKAIEAIGAMETTGAIPAIGAIEAIGAIRAIERWGQWRHYRH